jgi:hypothetical protein
MVRQVIKDMFAVCADITIALRTALVTVEGSTNDFGDTQLSVDVSGSYSFDSSRYIVGVFVSSTLIVCSLSAYATGYRRQLDLGSRQKVRCRPRGCFRGRPDRPERRRDGKW